MTEIVFAPRKTGNASMSRRHRLGSMAIPWLMACVVSHFASDLAGQTNDDFHFRTNELYREFLEKGIYVAKQRSPKLAVPTLPDGFDKQGQTKAIQTLAGDDYPLEELLRASVVAPHIFKFRNLDASDAASHTRGIDLWFVAYGKLESMTSERLQSHFLANRRSNQITLLKEADLTRRGINRQAKATVEENYLHAVGSILDRVQLSSTNRAMLTRGKDSIVLAAHLDRRFAQDVEFPNQWRAITLQDDGKEIMGPAQSYEGVGMYVRLTRLQEPAGAIFVEYHQIFAEPSKWFNAPNMLGSKLPLLIQAEVRAFRRDLLKLKTKE
jgi:hypothetical protein